MGSILIFFYMDKIPSDFFILYKPQISWSTLFIPVSPPEKEGIVLSQESCWCGGFHGSQTQVWN